MTAIFIFLAIWFLLGLFGACGLFKHDGIFEKGYVSILDVFVILFLSCLGFGIFIAYFATWISNNYDKLDNIKIIKFKNK